MVKLIEHQKNKHMSTIQLNEIQLEYIEKGRGDPLILVHCTLGD